MSGAPPVLRDSDIEANDSAPKKRTPQPSALARGAVGLWQSTIGPMVDGALLAIRDPKTSVEQAKGAILGLLHTVASAAVDPQAAGIEIGRSIVDPIAQDYAAGNTAGAVGRGVGTAAMLAAPFAGEIAEGAEVAGAVSKGAVKGGARAAIEPVHYGHYSIPIPAPIAGAAAGGYAARMLGLPSEVGAVVGGAAPIVRGAVSGVREALAAREASAAVPEVIPGFNVASGSTMRSPRPGVPVEPSYTPPITGALPGAPTAASAPVAAVPFEAPAPAGAGPSAVESLRAELEAQLRDGIARANGFKKGFESIPEHNPERQKIEATAAAIARAEQGVPEAAAAPVAPPAAAAVTAVPPPPAAAPQPPLTGETPNQTPGVQLEPDFLRDEVRRQNTRARTMAEGSQEATAARASHVDDIVGSNRSNWVRKMARQFKNAGMTSEDAAALPAEDLDKVSQAVGVSPWSERSADTIDQFKAALDEMWKNAPKASQKVQDITTTGLGISGSEPTGIGGLMSRKPAAAPVPEEPPAAASQPTTAGEMMQGSTPSENPKILVGREFIVNTPELSARGVITKVNRNTVTFDAPYYVTKETPDGIMHGLKISKKDLAAAKWKGKP
jgi:hypothetical protein